MMLYNEAYVEAGGIAAHLTYIQEKEVFDGDIERSSYHRPDRTGNFLLDLTVIAHGVEDHYDLPGTSLSVDPYEQSWRINGDLYVEHGVDLRYTGSKEGLQELLTEIAAAGYGLPEHNDAQADPIHPGPSLRGFLAARDTIGAIHNGPNNPANLV